MVKPKKNTKTPKNTDNYATPERILIFGAAGYVGRMICDLFCASPDVREIIAIDMKPMPDILKRKKKITWIEADLFDNSWRERIKDTEPDIAIHAAWDLDKNADEPKNIDVSEKIFEYCFNTPSIKKIIYLSSILPYGAVPENNKDRRFEEGEMLRENEYPYAVKRKEAEALLARLYSASNRTKSVFVLRLGMVYGPMGVLLGVTHEPLLNAIRALPFIIDGGNDYGLQYVHEDDLIDLLAVLVFNRVPFKGYEVFNVAAEDILSVDELATFMKKSILKMPVLFIQLFLVLFGSKYSKEASKKGIWKYLCYPFFVDGSKLAKKLKFELLYSTKEALRGESGRYAHLVPKKEELKAEAEEIIETK